MQKSMYSNGEICSVIIHKRIGTAEYDRGEISLECKGHSTTEALEGMKELIKISKELELPK